MKTNYNLYGTSFLQIPELIDELKELIEAALINSTPVHLTPNATGSSDVHYFLDIEMATLGSSPSDYADYFDYLKMKEENGFSSDYDYFQLRLKVCKQHCRLGELNKIAIKNNNFISS